MRHCLAVLLLALLAGCSAAPDVTRVASAPTTMPAGKSFGPYRAAPSRQSNAEFARDFLRLVFELESGRSMPVLARFEGPVTIRLAGAGGRPTASRDLDLLIDRLRTEANLKVSRVGAGQAASISVELVEPGAIHRVAPNAACFVVPDVGSWSDFLRARRNGSVDWTALRERRTMAIFIPSHSSGQEIRDCLHEEIAQALGPVNDLFYLPDSIFNDDNFHSVLTGFDMDVLKVFYDPALSSGMTRDQVAARLPGILPRIRPQASPSPLRPDPGFTPQSWVDAIAAALGPDSRDFERIESARWALETARSMGWRDTRLGFSLYAYGRLNTGRHPDMALAAFAEADRLFATLPDTEIHSTHVALHSAAFALSAGHFTAALSIVERNIPVAIRAQNASLLSMFLMIRAAALEATGQPNEARAARLDSLGWARYAFASEAEINRRLEEINSMVPNWRRGGTS